MRTALREHPLKVAAWALGLLLLARAIFGAIHPNLPGVQYDEALFINAAREQLPGLFLYKEFLGLPTALMPYIGALKSWAYTPIFWLFDPSPEVIRLPTLLVGTAGIALVFEAVRRLVDLPTAIVAAVLLAIDASLFWFTRSDVGPNAIGFFLKGAALLGVAQLVRTGGRRWALLIVVALGAGVFNKLNFVWIVNAAVLCALPFAVVHRRTIREHWQPAAILGAGLAVLYAGFAWWSLTVDLTAQQSESALDVLQRNLPILERGTSSVLSGSAFEQLTLGTGGPAWGIGILIFALGMLAIPLALLRRPRAWVVAALAAMPLAIIAQALVTQQATAPWHFLEIYPFLQIGVAYTLTMAVRVPRSVALPAGALAIAIAGLLVAVQVDRTGHTFSALARGGQTPIWTPEIYDLSDEVDRHPGTVVVTDWGIANQLVAFDDGPGYRIREESFAAETAATPQARGELVQRTLTAPPPVYVVTRGPDTQIFPNARTNALAALGGELTPAGTFRAPDGRVMFQLWRVRGR